MQFRFIPFLIAMCMLSAASAAPHIKPIPVPRPNIQTPNISQNVQIPAESAAPALPVEVATTAQPLKPTPFALPKPRPNNGGTLKFSDDALAKKMPADMPLQSGKSDISQDKQQLLANISHAYSATKSFSADFVQVSNAQRVQGALLLQKPGKFLFSYSPPSTIFVVSDGKTVLVRDRKLKTNDVYLLDQTPLRVLLQPNLDFSKDVKVKRIFEEAGMIAVQIDESKSAVQGEITLYFTKDKYALKQWSIVDAQGVQTDVAISNIKTNVAMDAKNFAIDAEAIRQDVKTNSN